MFDGSIKPVEDIRINDVVMGDDSGPRIVKSLHSGMDEMYEVRSNKFEPYVVNSQHILCLKANYIGTHGGGIKKEISYSNISVVDYLTTSGKYKLRHKVYKTGAEFPKKPITIDPYFIGLWLGDGTSANLGITNIDDEIVDYIYRFAQKWNLKVRSNKITYTLTSGTNKEKNHLLLEFKKLDLINNKHIPNDYLINSRRNRLSLLAGLIDSDGHVDKNGKGIEITQKREDLAKQICFLAQSLGFHASLNSCKKKCQTGAIGTYFRVYIGGSFEEIPCLVARKKSIIKPTHKTNGRRRDNPLMSGFKIVPKGPGYYYGFEIDGNNKFLLGNFHVVHNTTSCLLKIREIAVRMPGSQILIMKKTLKEIRDDIWKTLYNPTDGFLASERIYGRLNKSNYEHHFLNGSKILFRQAGDAGDEKKLLGLDLSCIYFEQAENISKSMFEHALGRLTHWGDPANKNSRAYRYIKKYGTGEYASSIAKRPAHFFIMSCNPDTSSWIYDDIIRTCPKYNNKIPHIKNEALGWDIINFQTYDNAQLPNVKSFIEEQRMISSDVFFRRMIEGEWVGSEGLIYSHFNLEKHIISDFKYNDKNRFEIIVAIDPGSSWYTGVIFGAYDKQLGNYIVFDEVRIKDTIIDVISQSIKEILISYNIDINDVRFLIDAAANAKESSGISKADQYKQNKIYVTNANKQLGLERINGLFRQNRIYISGNCVYLLNDIKSYHFDKDGKPNKKSGPQAFDLADAFRYFINQFAYGLDYNVKKINIPKDMPAEDIRGNVYLTKIFNEATKAINPEEL